MLYDILIRLLGALGFSLIINAKGITTSTVVVSICIFLIFEFGILSTKKLFYWGLAIVPFFISMGFIIYNNYNHTTLYFLAALILTISTVFSNYLAVKMMDYKQQLHKTKDDSRELEDILKGKNRRLLEEQDQQVHMATLAERNRIAREIHDNVGHLLSRAILLLGAINTVNKDENLEPQLNMLAKTLDESMAKMRESVHDLHDDSIDLKKNFEDIIVQLKDFNVNTELDLDEELPKEIMLTLIGILKEAVTNIIKHSNGDSVSIILHQNYSFCTLSVYDNGTISPETKAKINSESADGIGLNNIRQRATSIGGVAYFYTNDGFTVFTRLPFGENTGE